MYETFIRSKFNSIIIYFYFILIKLSIKYEYLINNFKQTFNQKNKL